MSIHDRCLERNMCKNTLNLLSLNTPFIFCFELKTHTPRNCVIMRNLKKKNCFDSFNEDLD